MRATVEISMYPLSEEYELKILDFIKHIESVPELIVRVNETSTHIAGDYDLIFSTLQDGIRKVFESNYKSVFVLKVLGMDLLES